MRLPFQTLKTFRTSLSAEEVIAFVQERLSRRTKVLFFSQRDYAGSINGMAFNLYRKFHFSGRSFARIKGAVLSADPTLIEIKIFPHYWRILFFMIFPCVFLPSAILNDQMMINGVLRKPELAEKRIWSGLFGIGPMVWCYFDCIRPIYEAEKWLIDKLALKEKSRSEEMKT